MLTYLFVTTDEDHIEYDAQPLRGKTLAEAVKDAEAFYYRLSMNQQNNIDSAWVVSNREYEDFDFECWKEDFVDFFRRPLKWADEQNKVLIENTGGGIYIAYLYTTEHIYYVLDSDGWGFGKYDDTDEFYEGMCMNPLDIAEDPSGWTAEENQIYGRLKQALIDNGTYWGDVEDNDED